MVAGLASAGTSGHIVLVLQVPLAERDYQRFGIATFLSRGYRVSVIEAGPLLHPEVPQDRSLYSTLRNVSITIVANRRELARTLPVLQSADAIINLTESGYVSPRNLHVFRLLRRSGRPWVSCAANAFPGADRYRGGSHSLLARIRDALSRWREIRLLGSLIARLPPSWLGVPSPSFLVVGGRKSLRGRLADAHTQEIRAHAMDYDIYLQEAAVDRPERAVAVFIDEYRPYHRDMLEMGYESIVEPGAYFTKLRALFDRVESEFGLRVVIAASPRSDYSDKPGVFGEREIVRSKTASLIGSSRLVLAHRSTAIAFAILFNKPVLQIATRDNYEHSTQRPYFDAFAEVLGKPIAFYDDPAAVDLEGAMSIDDECYRSYRRDFVKQDGSPERLYWDLVLDALAAAGVFSDAGPRSALPSHAEAPVRGVTEGVPS